MKVAYLQPDELIMNNNVVLYRKYRPSSFKEVVGQEHVVATLTNALKQDRVSHAYLFAGPRGTGKTTIARLLAQELNKDARESSFDLIEIDAASNRGVDEIRALREGVRVGPTQGNYKIYLVDEVHMLTKEAFNAFLKTLEEPPEFVVFVLATTEPHKLPATVISRTQRFDFRRLTLGEIAGRLETLVKKEDMSAEKEALRLIAVEADGSMRDAESLLGQVMTLSGGEVTTQTVEQVLGLFSHGRIGEFTQHISAGERDAAIEWIQKLVDEGHDLHQFIKSLQRYIRKLLFVSMDDTLAERVKKEMNEDDFTALAAQAKELSTDEVRRWLQTFKRAEQDLNAYPLQQIALEVAVVELLSEE